MSTNSLQAVQARLGEHGVRDVKFFFDTDAVSAYPSKVKEEATFLVNQVLANKTKKMNSFDSEILPA